MFAEVVFIIFMLGIALQLGYVLYFFVHIFSLPRKTKAYVPHLPVSVIICAKNEAENLRHNLPAILAQRYTNAAGNILFEVIVVNDASTDDTQRVLDELSRQHPQLKVVTIMPQHPRTLPGKKFALSHAAPVAKHDILVMTDADCRPVSDHWLSAMAAPFHEGKELAAGYGRHEGAGTMLSSFIRFETVHTFLQYATYALAGKPYMAVGRNIAYKKELLLQAQQTEEWVKVPSGDDDFLIRTAGSENNMAIVADSAAFTTTQAKPDMNAWIAQKQRHLSTGKYYKWQVKALLGKYAAVHAWVWLCFLVLMFTGFWQLSLGVMALRCIVYWLVWWQAACALGEKKLIRFFPLFDIGWMIYNFAFSPYVIWKNKQQWT